MIAAALHHYEREDAVDKETRHAQELGASYIPAAIAAGTYLEEPTCRPEGPVLVQYIHAEDGWLVRPATAEESDLLDLPPNAAVIHLMHSVQDDTGQTLEVSESVWPSDRVIIIDDFDTLRPSRPRSRPRSATTGGGGLAGRLDASRGSDSVTRSPRLNSAT